MDSKAKCLQDDHAFNASTLHKQLDAFDDWFGEKCEVAHEVTSHEKHPDEDLHNYHHHHHTLVLIHTQEAKSDDEAQKSADTRQRRAIEPRSTTMDSKAKCLQDDHAFNASTLHKQLDAFDDWFGEKCEVAHEVTSHEKKTGPVWEEGDESDLDDSFAVDDDDDMMNPRRHVQQRNHSGALEQMFQTSAKTTGSNSKSPSSTPTSRASKMSSSEQQLNDKKEVERIRRLRASKQEDSTSRHNRTINVRPSSAGRERRDTGGRSRHRRTSSEPFDDLDDDDDDYYDNSYGDDDADDAAHSKPRSGRSEKPASSKSISRRHRSRGDDNNSNNQLGGRSEHGRSRRPERRTSLSPMPTSHQPSSTSSGLGSPSSEPRKPLSGRARRRMSLSGMSVSSHATSTTAPSVSPKVGDHQRKRGKSRDGLSISGHRRARIHRRGQVGATGTEELRGSDHGTSTHRRSNSNRRGITPSSSGELSRGSDHGTRRTHRRTAAAASEDGGSRRPHSNRRMGSNASASANDELNSKSDHSTSRRPHSNRRLRSSEDHSSERPASGRRLRSSEDHSSERPSSDRRAGRSGSGGEDDVRKPSSSRRPVSSSDVTGEGGGGGRSSRPRRNGSSDDIANLARSEHRGHRISSRRRESMSTNMSDVSSRHSSDDPIKSQSVRPRRRLGGDALSAGSEHTPRGSASVRATRTSSNVSAGSMRSPRSREGLNTLRRERSGDKLSSQGMKRVESTGSSFARAQARRQKQAHKGSLGRSGSSGRVDSFFDDANNDSMPSKPGHNATWDNVPKKKISRPADLGFDPFSL
eukprot:CAMPEP_0119571186 /NCGR_PEP_ID=MMETSP1352-20130426/43990_1 /TAXON_ID=265584 /ORGANISM="Stauroneis constricta, Strain CCMP1120" /LENGTH=805 /DNA_ID=CAMNT_0007620865 /DNA_START=322 /DNA_END=2740 /DNA_ORIENTATION=+